MAQSVLTKTFDVARQMRWKAEGPRFFFFFFFFAGMTWNFKHLTKLRHNHLVICQLLAKTKKCLPVVAMGNNGLKTRVEYFKTYGVRTPRDKIAFTALHGRKFNPNPKFLVRPKHILSATQAKFFRQVSLIYAFIG